MKKQCLPSNNMCGTVKFPFCSKPVITGHRSKRCNISLTISNLYLWAKRSQDVIQQNVYNPEREKIALLIRILWSLTEFSPAHPPTHLKDSLHDADSPVSGNGGPDDDGPLRAEGREEEVKADCGVPVSLKEGHQKPKANVDHHMHILEHWKEQLSTLYIHVHVLHSYFIKKDDIYSSTIRSTELNSAG